MPQCLVVGVRELPFDPCQHKNGLNRAGEALTYSTYFNPVLLDAHSHLYYLIVCVV